MSTILKTIAKYGFRGAVRTLFASSSNASAPRPRYVAARKKHRNGRRRSIHVYRVRKESTDDTGCKCRIYEDVEDADLPPGDRNIIVSVNIPVRECERVSTRLDADKSEKSDDGREHKSNDGRSMLSGLWSHLRRRRLSNDIDSASPNPQRWWLHQRPGNDGQSLTSSSARTWLYRCRQRRSSSRGTNHQARKSWYVDAAQSQSSSGPKKEGQIPSPVESKYFQNRSNTSHGATIRSVCPQFNRVERSLKEPDGPGIYNDEKMSDLASGGIDSPAYNALTPSLAQMPAPQLSRETAKASGSAGPSSLSSSRRATSRSHRRRRSRRSNRDSKARLNPFRQPDLSVQQSEVMVFGPQTNVSEAGQSSAAQAPLFVDGARQGRFPPVTHPILSTTETREQAHGVTAESHAVGSQGSAVSP